MTEGTKYHPLFEYLLFSGKGRMSMTFAEIEKVLNVPLPPSARGREEWWSNSPSGHSQARAWRRANYRTSQVNLAGETVTFTLKGWPESYVDPHFAYTKNHAPSGMQETSRAYEPPRDEGGSGGEVATDHPLFGIWEGKVTLNAAHDYTKPAFEPDPTP